MSQHTTQVSGQIWIHRATQNFMGHERVFLLEKIAELGSITQAAKAVGMSYKTAWETIDSMNNLSPHVLVIRTTGGRGGGGTQLTEYGHKLVEFFKMLEQAHQQFLSQLSLRVENFDMLFQTVRMLQMKTSARNQFFGIISQIQQGHIHAEVELSLKGEDKLIATVTTESLQRLGLSMGQEVYALIKAPAIFLMRADTTLQTSARNCVYGTVRHIHHDALSAEVTLALAGGNVLRAVITYAALVDLGIQTGENVLAAFKASSVILAIPDE
jgi:molybdate transport system regulatory protein